MFPDRLKARGSYGRWFGVACGGWIANDVFTLLNSEQFCRRWLGKENGEVIWPVTNFLYFIIIYCLVTSWVIFMFASERLDKVSKVTTGGNVWSAIRQIFKKPLTKKWIKLTMCKRLGTDGAMSILSVILVNEGLDKEFVVLGTTLAGPFILMGTFFLMFCLKKGRIMKTSYSVMWLGIPCIFMNIITYTWFKARGDEYIVYFLACAAVFRGWWWCTIWILDLGQMSIMCDENVNSTHWAAMNTIWNISNTLPY